MSSPAFNINLEFLPLIASSFLLSLLLCFLISPTEASPLIAASYINPDRRCLSCSCFPSADHFSPPFPSLPLARPWHFRLLSIAQAPLPSPYTNEAAIPGIVHRFTSVGPRIYLPWSPFQDPRHSPSTRSSATPRFPYVQAGSESRQSQPRPRQPCMTDIPRA